MTIGKAQLKDSSDEEHDPDGRRALDEVFIRAKPTRQEPPAKGKIIQVDRGQFQDIDKKVAKQKAADAFRQRFTLRPQLKAPPPPGSHPAIDSGDDDGIGDIDDFLGELRLDGKDDVCIICFFPASLLSARLTVSCKVCEWLRFAVLTVLLARTPGQGSFEKTRMPVSSGTGKGLRSEEEDDKWLDEMLGLSGARAAAAAKLQSRR